MNRILALATVLVIAAACSPKAEEAPAAAADMAAPVMVDSMATTMTDSAHSMMDSTAKMVDSAATAAAKKTM